MSAFQCERPDDCQALTDPFLLEMEFAFFDRDADLGAGTFQLFIDGNELGTRTSLRPLFEAAGIPLTSTEGVLPVDIPLTLSDVVDGKEFDVALEVTDAASHPSNRPGVRFRLDLK